MPLLYECLGSKGIKYEDVSVDGEPELREEMIRKSERRIVPQIWIGDEHIGGCDELFLLEQNNSLDIMIRRLKEEAAELND